MFINWEWFLLQVLLGANDGKFLSTVLPRSAKHNLTYKVWDTVPPNDSLMLLGSGWMCHTLEYTPIGFYNLNDYYYN